MEEIVGDKERFRPMSGAKASGSPVPKSDYNSVTERGSSEAATSSVARRSVARPCCFSARSRSVSL